MREILVVSFGTTHPQQREAAIGGIERQLQSAFPQERVARCFTSSMVIRRIAEQEQIQINNPEQSLQQALAEGVTELIAVPTHLMDGKEYQKFQQVLDRYRDRFERVKSTGPLLSGREDVDGVISAIRKVTKEFDDGHTAIVLVGHGTEDIANQIYTLVQERLELLGYERYLVGTIEAKPGFEEVKANAEELGVSRLVLLPFMVVAGEHAVVDIAGAEQSSWKSCFEAAGYEVIVIQKGLGEFDQIQRIYVRHATNALENA